jgi:flagellar motor switch protein FliN/FliY
MAGVTPNEPEGLSQEDIDAALAAASGGPVGAAGPEGAAPVGEVPAAAPTNADEPVQEDVPAAEPAGTLPVAEAVSPVEASIESGEFAGLSQEDIDAALAGATRPAPAAPAPVKLDSAGRPYDEMAAMMEAAIAEERAKAQTVAAAPASIPSSPVNSAPPPAPLPPLPAGAMPLELPGFSGGAGVSSEGIELLNDVELNVKIELGRAEMLIEEVLRLGDGAVVELDKLAGDPVDVLVNDRLVARGEVIVLNENFCVRVSEIVAGVSDEENN